MIDGNGRRKAGDFFYIGLLHLAEELARDGQPDVVEEIPVAFTAEAKQEIVAKLRAAHGGANHAGAD